jgi:hypothetical protein
MLKYNLLDCTLIVGRAYKGLQAVIEQLSEVHTFAHYRFGNGLVIFAFEKKNVWR